MSHCSLIFSVLLRKNYANSSSRSLSDLASGRGFLSLFPVSSLTSLNSFLVSLEFCLTSWCGL